jgi:transcriptional regulator with XRE-family HTH domain
MAATNHFSLALRAWRERLSPQGSGLETGGDRRVPGLRREELAHLAGLSTDYVVRLEQGRARSPSPQVVGALARALRLEAAERDHLFRCAGLLPPSGANVPMRVPPQVERLVRGLGDTPAAVFAADWTIITWNAMWTAAIGDPTTYGWSGRNLVAGMFRSIDGRRPPIAAWPVRSRAGDQAEEAALVADLRVTAASYPTDARLASLVDHMVRASPRFAELWFDGTARPFTNDRKTVAHPLVGEINLDLDVLIVPDADLRVVTYTNATSGDAQKLDLLRVENIQPEPRVRREPHLQEPERHGDGSIADPKVRETVGHAVQLADRVAILGGQDREHAPGLGHQRRLRP